ncbi:PilZ domain protein [bacterium BMS3Abin07]|nr:PilZ domain protein [bacterium BMS3Abin07]GBE31581.1 PilZ domain protein [bacterium BMS3Bbin05]
MKNSTRKHHRYPYIASAAIRERNIADAEPVTVMVNNISEGGMGVFIETPFKKGTKVSIEVNFINLYGSEIKDVIHGEVSGLTERDTLYFMGISFDKKIDPYKQPNLYELFNQSIKGD